MNMRQHKRARAGRISRTAIHYVGPIIVQPKPVQIRVVRRCDGVFFGEYASMEEAELVIAKAKAQKRATLILA